MFQNRKMIWLHVLYWLLALVDFMFISNWFAQQGGAVYYQDNGLQVHPMLYHFISHAPTIILTAAFFYLHLLIVIPHFFERKKYVQYGLAVIVTVSCLYLPLRYLIEEHFYKWIGGSGLSATNMLYWSTDSSAYILRYCFVAVAYYLTWRWLTNEKENQELRSTKLATELAFLKSQLNPHFLFNTLSNIHSLAYTGSAETAPAVLKLSDMMRYMLYDSDATEVDLEEELNYLRNYIDLQQMRSGTGASIELQITGNTAGGRLAPLLLVPFVENIFKHGNLGSGQTAKVIIESEPQKLSFYAKNKVAQYDPGSTSGIGIANTRRRLALLYPHRHLLDIRQKDDIYEVRLVITFPYA